MSLVIVNPYITVAPTYTFSAPATASKYEGESITYTVSTTGFQGTLYWTIESVTGTVSNADFSSPANAVTAGGSVIVTNGTGSFTLTLATDALTETESYRVRLRINSTSGEIVATSNTITILDSPTGEDVYTTAGTYTWVAPAGVYSVSAVAVGGGGGGSMSTTGIRRGAGGGGLGWKNNISVIPGNSYTVEVGVGGTGDPNSGSVNEATSGGQSYFISASIVAGNGGGRGGTAEGSGGSFVGDGGGSGGTGPTNNNMSGGAGAGGYSGNGGTQISTSAPTAGSGGGGGGGGHGNSNIVSGSGGGGVGLYGQGSNGGAGTNTPTTTSTTPPVGGGGGSGGNNGDNGALFSGAGDAVGPAGGNYGGGGGTGGGSTIGNRIQGGNGGSGAVRIIYGAGRSFPNNAA